MIDELKLKKTIELKKNHLLNQNIKLFFNSILPIEFTGNRWYIRFYQRLQINHDWFGIFLPYSYMNSNSIDTNYRSIRWIAAIGKIINIMLVDTILAVSSDIHIFFFRSLIHFFNQNDCLTR